MSNEMGFKITFLVISVAISIFSFFNIFNESRIPVKSSLLSTTGLVNTVHVTRTGGKSSSSIIEFNFTNYKEIYCYSSSSGAISEIKEIITPVSKLNILFRKKYSYENCNPVYSISTDTNQGQSYEEVVERDKRDLMIGKIGVSFIIGLGMFFLLIFAKYLVETSNKRY